MRRHLLIFGLLALLTATMSLGALVAWAYKAPELQVAPPPPPPASPRVSSSAEFWLTALVLEHGQHVRIHHPI